MAVFCFISVPDAPNDVYLYTNFSRNEVNVTWDRPIVRNGEILHYMVSWPNGTQRLWNSLWFVTTWPGDSLAPGRLFHSLLHDLLAINWTIHALPADLKQLQCNNPWKSKCFLFMSHWWPVTLQSKRYSPYIRLQAYGPSLHNDTSCPNITVLIEAVNRLIRCYLN